MDNKLGRAAYLTIGTTNVDTSMGLYEKLGFKRENEGSAPVRWTEICDGSLHIILVEGKDEYLGLTYVSDDIDSGIETLKGWSETSHDGGHRRSAETGNSSN